MTEIRLSERGVAKIRVLYGRPAQIGFAKVSPLEVGVVEACPYQSSLGQLRIA